MKLKIVCFLIIALVAIISTTSYSANFSNDKKFSDTLTNNKFVSQWVAVPESQIPSKLKPMTVTDCIIDGKKICLVPFTVLLFDHDGTFTYLWEINGSTTGEISGKWKVENSILIFTLGKEYSPIYKKDSELRYKIMEILPTGASLKYSCVGYPGIPEIIKTSNDPLKDFANIVVSIERTDLKNTLTKQL